MAKKVVLSNTWMLEDDQALHAYARHMMKKQVRSNKYPGYEIYDPSSKSGLPPLSVPPGNSQGSSHGQVRR